MSKISIVIPIYNVNKLYFEKCMQSILNQTLTDIEIILIDDGSNNGIEQYCDYIEKQDNRIKVLHQPNQGVSISRNRGIEVAQSEWIMFVDADDWIELDACERLYKYVNNKETDIIIGRAYLNIDNKDKETFYEAKDINEISEEKEKRELQSIILTDKHIKYSYISVPWGKLYKSRFLKDNTIEYKSDISYGEDNLFNWKAYEKAKKILILNEIIYHYRVNQESVTHVFTDDILVNMERLYKNFEEQIGDDKYFAEALNYYKIRCLNHIFTTYYKTDNDTKFVKQILKKPIYSKAIKEAKVNNFTRFKKIIICLAKMKFYYGIKILYKIKNKLKH